MVRGGLAKLFLLSAAPVVVAAATPVQADTLRIENRGGTLWTYSYTFLC